MVVEDDIGVSVAACHNVGPKFEHEKYLISELGRGSVLGSARFFYPVGEVAHKVQEKGASGTLMTLSDVLTNKLKPSGDSNRSR